MTNIYALPFRQPIDYLLVTPAAGLAVSLANVKDWLKIPTTLSIDDSLITHLIKSATGYFEKITGRDLLTKTYKTYLDSFPITDGLYYYSGVSPLLPQYQDNGIVLRKSPLGSVSSIQYYADGVLTTWASLNYYTTVNTDYSGIYLVQNKSFPTDVDVRKQAVVINFTAGYGVDDTFIPEDIQQALLRFISFLYDNRGDCADNSKQNAAIAYFTPFKIVLNI
jgi:hypothetical protein